MTHPRPACCGDGPTTRGSPLGASFSPGGPQQVLWHIHGMCCSSERNEIRQALETIPGIRDLRFLAAERSVALTADAPGQARAEAAMRQLGYVPQRRAPQPARTGNAGARDSDSPPWRRLIAALLLAAAAELLHNLLPPLPLHTALEIALAVAAILLAGLPVYLRGLTALRRGRLNVNALMTVAVSGAFLIGEWPEAAMVMALFALAEALEEQASDRARQAIRRLMELAPEQATLERRPGEWVRVAVDAVAIGQRLRVEPGERVPLDGVVEAGSSSIDQAPVTGESLPVEKEAGDAVFAGTINGQGSLIIRANATAAGSTIARIIAAVEEAQATRAPLQRIIDRFAARYTPAVFLLALAVALLSPALLSISPLEGVYRALVLLVIACPCALVIATPVTLVSGLTTAARRGIVIKGGLFLEQARRLAFIAFDKTGTITTGHPRLVAFEALSGRVDGATLRRWTASLAARSDHPVSRAIAAGLQEESLEVENFEAIPGRGVRGGIRGRRLLLASPRWIRELGLGGDELEQSLMRQSRQGRSLSLLADEEEVLALLAVADQVRPTAAEAIARLRTLGLTPVMLTGDNATTAAVIAAEAGIEHVRSALLPEQKLEAVAELGQRGPTAMVGDGINDAPALAGARIGFAMGAAGSDTAMEAADIVIMDDEPLRLVDTVLLSRRTVRILWQNILLAVGIKGAFLVLTLRGSTSMWQAVFADMGTSLLVIANGMRLLHQRWDGGSR